MRRTLCCVRLRTGVEQVSIPTAVECGLTDREPSGKFTEQPKLQDGRGFAPTVAQAWPTGKQIATFCCYGLTGYCFARVATPSGRYQASFGAVAPPRSCRFLLMRESCGLSIGMTDGDVRPTLSKAVWSSTPVGVVQNPLCPEQALSRIQRSEASSSSNAETIAMVATGSNERLVGLRAPDPCGRTESPQPVSSARRR